MIIWQQQPADISVWKGGKRVVFLKPLRMELVKSRLWILFFRLILLKMKWCKIWRWRAMVELTQHTSQMFIMRNLIRTLNRRTTTETYLMCLTSRTMNDEWWMVNDECDLFQPIECFKFSVEWKINQLKLLIYPTIPTKS